MRTKLMRNMFDLPAVRPPRTTPSKASVFNWRNVRAPSAAAPTTRKASFFNFTPARRDADSRR